MNPYSKVSDTHWLKLVGRGVADVSAEAEAAADGAGEALAVGDGEAAADSSLPIPLSPIQHLPSAKSVFCLCKDASLYRTHRHRTNRQTGSGRLPACLSFEPPAARYNGQAACAKHDMERNTGLPGPRSHTDMLDFTAIDFETANRHKTSACSIGIAVVENGAITKTHHFLINPYPDYFHPMNIRIHGIEAEDVQDAPTFAELWPVIRPLIDDKIIAAHNASFDMGVLLGCLDHYGLERPEIDILCSCRMAKAAYPALRNHKLDTVCSYLSLALDHHRADSDAEGCAGIILDIAKRYKLSSLEEVHTKLRVQPGYIRSGEYLPISRW